MPRGLQRSYAFGRIVDEKEFTRDPGHYRKLYFSTQRVPILWQLSEAFVQQQEQAYENNIETDFTPSPPDQYASSQNSY